MPNQLTFEVYFKKEDIRQLIEDENITQICITGTFNANGDNSKSIEIKATGFDKKLESQSSSETNGNSETLTFGTSAAQSIQGCPKPC